MTIEDLEQRALRLDPPARARLAERLLESLEHLSEEENERLWAEEAQRRDHAWNRDPESGRPAEAVIEETRRRLE